MKHANQEATFDTGLAVALLETVDAVEAGELSLRDGDVQISLRRDAATPPTRGGAA